MIVVKKKQNKLGQDKHTYIAHRSCLWNMWKKLRKESVLIVVGGEVKTRTHGVASVSVHNTTKTTEQNKVPW